MKIYTKVIVDIETNKIVEEESYEYSGPIAQCQDFNWGPGGPPQLPQWTPEQAKAISELSKHPIDLEEAKAKQAEAKAKQAEIEKKWKDEWFETPPEPTDPNYKDYIEFIEKKALLDKLREQEAWLSGKHGAYTEALEEATGRYGDTLTALANRLNAPESRVGFSIGGQAPVSFVPRQTIRDIGVLEALAQKGMGAEMTVPTQQWAYYQEHPLYKPELQYFDIAQQLAQAEENRRYNLPSQLQFGSLSQPSADWLTKLGVLGNLARTGMGLYQGGQDLGWWGG